MVPNIDGSLDKRLAVNYESAYALSATANTLTEEQTGAFSCEDWNSVGGNGSRNYAVVQRNDMVFFYTNSGSDISATEKSFSLNLGLYKAPGNPNIMGYSPIAVANCNGKLLITSADTDPVLVSYNEATDNISHAAVTLQIRDIYGAADGLAVDTKPATLSNTHQYNLLNQGWDQVKIDAYFAAKTVYPSNAQTWTAGKDTSDDFQPSLLDKQDFGTSPAARGRFILALFNRDRTASSSVAGLLVETDTYRPTTCAFFAGRAWYAGTRSSAVGTWVMFSQVAETDDKYGKCYQDADPTSEVISDLVASDGGIIPIQDAGTIVHLRPFVNSLLVFADNGVWQISGSIASGFSATSYEIRKIASVGCVSAKTIVEAEQALYWWSADGIWVLSSGENALTSDPVLTPKGLSNISNTTVQRYYTGSIPVTARAYAAGRYYLEGKTIYWSFNADPAQDGVTRRFKKTKLLCIDLRLKAFYTVSVASLVNYSPYITDLLITKNKAANDTTYNVVDAAVSNVVVGTDQVVVSLIPGVLKNSEVRFLVQAPQAAGTSFQTTFARFEDGLTPASKFSDWYAADGVGIGYDAYVVPGYDLGNAQGGDKAIQGLYCVVFMRRTETGVDASGNPISASSCTLQARWDWTDSAVAGKWSAAREVYRHNRPFFPSVPSATFNDGYPVVVTKNKIRGRGKALQLKFSADPAKDMQLLGWAVIYVGNSNV